jgi:hypothetical protein
LERRENARIGEGGGRKKQGKIKTKEIKAK